MQRTEQPMLGKDANTAATPQAHQVHDRSNAAPSVTSTAVELTVAPQAEQPDRSRL